MSGIQTFKDVLTDDELKICMKKIDANGWHYTGSSGITARKFWFMDLGDDNFFSEVIFDKIKALVGRDLVAQRIYANGQTYGLDGDFHKDNCDFTFLLYVSPIKKFNVNTICGHTQFHIKDQEGVLSIEPIQNTGVLFDGHTLHRGTAPSRDSNMLRITVAYKCKVKPSPD